MKYTIGVDIGGTNIKIGLVNWRGEVVRRRTLHADPAEPAQVTLARLAQSVVKLSSNCPVKVLGVGVAGLVDCRSGVVKFSPNLPLWMQVSVKDTLAKLTGLEVYCANDADAVTIGEWLFGVAKGFHNVLCLTLGTGVGSGIIANNQPLWGANCFAGELGHTVIFLNGSACGCGDRGCLESYVGARALVQKCKRLLRRQQPKFANLRNQLALFVPDIQHQSKIWEKVGYDLRNLTPQEIGAAARMKDQLACRVVGDMGRLLGLGIYNAIMILDPELVVIGGGMSRIGMRLLLAVKNSVLSHPYLQNRKVKIVLSRLREDAGILGASQLNRFVPVNS
ncbi:MAG: ROK family protein [bacterium]